jgi:small Trp-rich protein
MWFVGIGTLLVLMKWLEFGPVGGWSWIAVLTPFGLALAWWAWADSTGYTQRREMDKMDQKRLDRRRKAMESLGLQNPKRRRRW